MTTAKLEKHNTELGKFTAELRKHKASVVELKEVSAEPSEIVEIDEWFPYTVLGNTRSNLNFKALVHRT